MHFNSKYYASFQYFFKQLVLKTVNWQLYENSQIEDANACDLSKWYKA